MVDCVPVAEVAEVVVADVLSVLLVSVLSVLSVSSVSCLAAKVTADVTTAWCVSSTSQTWASLQATTATATAQPAFPRQQRGPRDQI